MWGLVLLAALSDVSPVILQSAEEKYSSEVAKAEAELGKTKSAAAAARLKTYRDKLAEETKSGNFEKASAVKARIDQLEADPESAPQKAPKKPRPKDTVKFQGHTYALIKEPAPWHMAKQRCEEMGGHLVTLENKDEMLFVASICTTTDWTWAGATDEEKEGVWKWVTGKTITDTSWMAFDGQEEQHYLGYNRTNKVWCDCNEEHRIHYVCEWDH